MSFTYKLYTGDSTNLASVDTIEGETFESEGTDVNKLSTTQPKDEQTEYFANVLAIHIPTGQKAVYQVQSITTAQTPPSAGGSATTSDITTSGFTVNWPEATDPNYTHAQLTYKVYSSDTGNIDSIANAEANGTLEVSDTGITSYQFTNLQPETGKFISIVVENPDGLKGFYSMISEVTNPESDVTPSGTVTDISIAELSQSFEVSFDNTNVTDAFGYDVQFSDVGGANASIHDIGDNTTATIAKSAITSYGETKTLEVRIRAYADEDGAWSSTVNIETNTEGVGTAVIEIETA